MFDGLFAVISGAISGFWGLLGGLFSPAPAPQDFVKFDDPVVVIEEKKEVEKAEEIEETAAPLVNISQKNISKKTEAKEDKGAAVMPVLGE